MPLCNTVLLTGVNEACDCNLIFDASIKVEPSRGRSTHRIIFGMPPCQRICHEHGCPPLEGLLGVRRQNLTGGDTGECAS